MRRIKLLSLVALVVGQAACYHVTVVTGRPEGTAKIEKPWTNSFVLGLVPPPEFETASKCPAGLARVDIQRSFLNGLVGAITQSIYTPLDVRIYCAASGTGSRDVRSDSTQRVGSAAPVTANPAASAAQPAPAAVSKP